MGIFDYGNYPPIYAPSPPFLRFLLRVLLIVCNSHFLVVESSGASATRPLSLRNGLVMAGSEEDQKSLSVIVARMLILAVLAVTIPNKVWSRSAKIRVLLRAKLSSLSPHLVRSLCEGDGSGYVKREMEH